MKKAVAIAFAITLLGALTFLSLKVREFSDKEHDQFQTALWRLKQLDTTFNEDVLEARFALQDNYDDFQACEKELERTVVELQAAPAFIDSDGRAAIERARGEYAAVLQQRQKLFEQFKSQNAVLANSRRYLPLALEQFEQRRHQSPANEELDTLVNDLARLALMRLSSPDELPQNAETLLMEARAWGLRHPDHPERGSVESLARHVQTIVTGNGEVDTLTRQLLALPSEPIVQKLFQAYEADVSKALRRSQVFRKLLYALAVLLLAGVCGTVWALGAANRQLERRVRERTRDLTRTEERFRLITENAADMIAILDAQGQPVYQSPSYARLLGDAPSPTPVQGAMLERMHPDDRARVVPTIQDVIRTGHDCVIEYQLQHRDGRWLTCESHIAPFRRGSGAVESVLAVARDITERKEAEKARQLLEVQLRQAQKLEAVGQLSAGIAHEINTPTQYVGDNTRFLRDSFDSVAKVLRAYEQLLQAVREQAVTPELIAQVEEVLTASDLEYLFEQIPAAIGETLEGIARVTKIVRAMKEFSHPGGQAKTPADLNRAIETTVTVAHGEWKYVADLNLELDPELPAVPCFIGEFNQCILNLIVNAAHAIGDAIRPRPGTKGLIVVTTRRDGAWVEVRVSDSGMGIPESVRPRIFEPFFTTKDVGKGTGQGLSIVYGSIVKKHGGNVSFESEVGKGTTFILRLPLQPSVETAPRGSDSSRSSLAPEFISRRPAVETV